MVASTPGAEVEIFAGVHPGTFGHDLAGGYQAERVR
jgi:hypothetical protein